MRSENGRVLMVVGLQFGSEGKGHVMAYISAIASAGIRTGASHAGHTVYVENERVVVRQIPAAFVNPRAELLIGAGTLISLDVLLEEIAMLERIVPVRHRLRIDPRAHVITEDQKRREAETDLAERIGSTSATAREGIGIAAADKVLRKAACVQARSIPKLRRFLANTSDIANELLDRGEFVAMEATQGFSLDVDFGPFPYVTGHNTTPMALAASAGIATHRFDTEVIGVVRTYPIRVAGKSGPFAKGSREVSWPYVTRKCGAPKPIEEYTSVTRKLRRVATFSWHQFEEAVEICRPSEIALMFADYLDWNVHEREELSAPVMGFINELEEAGLTEVKMVATGPKTIVDFDPYRASILRKIA
jgi:adenylosuccinate synthase